MSKILAILSLAVLLTRPVFGVDPDANVAPQNTAAPAKTIAETAVLATSSPSPPDLPAATAPNPAAQPVTGFAVPAPPALKASAWLLIDFNSGAVLAEGDPEARVAPASLTKIMTIYSIAQLLKEGRIKLTDSVPISARARNMTGSRMFVEVGTNVTIEELMKGDIIQSGNDASVALAEYVAGSEEVFASLMNRNAARLGMTGTHFTNSTGLPDANHYTTARDLSRLAVALVREHPDVYRWFSIKEFTHHGITQPNRNKLLWRDPSVDGIKTGYHEAAGYCLAASAQRDGMRLIAIVVGTESENARADVAQALLNHGFQFYETRKLFNAGQPVKSLRVWKGEQESVALGIREDLYVTVPRGQAQQLQSAIHLGGRLIAPIAADQNVGQLNVTFEGRSVAEQPLVALQAVNEARLWGRTVDSVKLMFEE